MASAGISEVVGATILLAIAVALSLLIFGYFYGYIQSLGYALTGVFTRPCEFTIISTAINRSGQYITSVSIAIYNYGKAQCDLSGIYILNESITYPVAVAGNCMVNPIIRLGPGQVAILNYANLDVPYGANYVVRVVSCDGFMAEEGLGQ